MHKILKKLKKKGNDIFSFLALNVCGMAYILGANLHFCQLLTATDTAAGKLPNRWLCTVTGHEVRGSAWDNIVICPSYKFGGASALITIYCKGGLCCHCTWDVYYSSSVFLNYCTGWWPVVTRATSKHMSMLLLKNNKKKNLLFNTITVLPFPLC